jgi:porphobilinogen deaminase
MRRPQRLRREVCGDKGKCVGVILAARVVGLRGNVPTRLRKFIESDWDAIILARAGLERLGFIPPEFEFQGQKLFAEILSPENFVPAGGQGVIALQTRATDWVAREIMYRRLMTWKRIFVYERSGSFCGYCKEIAICRWACTLNL